MFTGGVTPPASVAMARKAATTTQTASQVSTAICRPGRDKDSVMTSMSVCQARTREETQIWASDIVETPLASLVSTRSEPSPASASLAAPPSLHTLAALSHHQPHVQRVNLAGKVLKSLFLPVKI